MITLVTGGAGFIGSHVADGLLAAGHEVRVLDDLFSGKPENLDPRATLTVGSVADPDALDTVMPGVEVVFHLAAIGAVARSVDNPLATDHANVHGTLAVLHAARTHGARRVVFASSSSVYGGAATPPTSEQAPLRPKSPYAVSKLAGEEYCRVFSELFPLETVALRYFNVFGPRQRPDSLYAAVIPLFITALLEGSRPTVHGDGLQSRDFTFISDVVAANLAAAAAPAEACSGRVFNIAGGWTHSLLDLLGHLGTIIGVTPDPVFDAPRPGDVKLSQADASEAARALGFQCSVPFEEGLRQTVEWARSR